MEAGQQIRDYILEEKVGEGLVAEVWRAHHQHLDKTVAIKAIHRHSSQDSDFRARFLEEASIEAKFEHPHIVPLYEFFILDGIPYLVMGYIEGGSLADLLAKRGRLPLHEVLAISREILDALNFAHNQGVIHRDVKPSNILVKPDGHVCLVDFGIALVVGQRRHTQFGTSIGTPEYMSPEQIQAKKIDHRTDVYSFGCVLYEMLTGRPPFGSRDEGKSEYDIMDDHVHTPPPPLRALNPEVEEHIEAVVLCSLAKKPDQRYGGCQEFTDDLYADRNQPRPCRFFKTKYLKTKYLAILFLLLALIGILVHIRVSLYMPDTVHLLPDTPDIVQRVPSFMDRFFPQGGDFRVNLWPDKSGEAVYAEGENLVVRFQSDTDAYVQVDYYQAGGQVLHLQDGSFSRARMGILLDTSLLPIKVEPPFGRGIVTIIASETPLMGVTKESTESASTYLDHLTQYLQTQKTQGKWAGAYFKVITQATNTVNASPREAPTPN